MANTKIIVRLHQIFFIIKSIIYIIDMLAPKNASISSLCSDLWWDGNWPTRNKGQLRLMRRASALKNICFGWFSPIHGNFPDFPVFSAYALMVQINLFSMFWWFSPHFPKWFHILSHFFIVQPPKGSEFSSFLGHKKPPPPIPVHVWDCRAGADRNLHLRFFFGRETAEIPGRCRDWARC